MTQAATDRPFIILGGGGHACVVLSTLRALGAHVVGFTDPSPDAELGDLKHLGNDSALKEVDPMSVYCAVGIGSTNDTGLRADVYRTQREAGFSFTPLVHPAAFVASEAKLGRGSQVMAGAMLQTGVVLADNVLVNTGASIDHHGHVAAHAHVAPGAVLSGNVEIGTGTHVGTGAILLQGVSVGEGAVVGAGAVVTNDVPAGTTVVGIPAEAVER